MAVSQGFDPRLRWARKHSRDVGDICVKSAPSRRVGSFQRYPSHVRQCRRERLKTQKTKLLILKANSVNS
ncbi:hypothetical protein OS493_008935 [Desmophyllum pertusum]|uniref:Uncharacterized protein n=1 Tax=Desmophyllum pertusum TaxID=174260 RepID=A0A9X0D0N2_9CNID|nr:hypothetical protein OS493_008935 [Desmophyllum pertusum]